MSDDTLPLEATLISGMGSCGKTTYALRYMKYCPGVACRFIYDDLGVVSRYTGLRVCKTESQLEAALPSKWVLYNPVVMFPGDIIQSGPFKGRPGAGFKFWCEWALDVSKRGPGKKFFFVDELWRWCTPQFIPPWFAMLQQVGRIEGVEVVTATQRPNLINGSITGQATEIVTFRLQERSAIATIADLSQGNLSPQEIANLPKYKYLALNTLSGCVVRG